MTKLSQRILLAAALASATWLAAPTTAIADDYWNNYWGWYDGSYRPYYNGYYYAAPSVYSYPNYGIRGTPFYSRNFYRTPYWPTYTTYPYYYGGVSPYRGFSWHFNWW